MLVFFSSREKLLQFKDGNNNDQDNRLFFYTQKLQTDEQYTRDLSLIRLQTPEPL